MDITERKITEITREAEKLEAKGYLVRRDAEQTLRGIQGGKPGRLFPLSVHCSGTMPVRENS